MAELDVGKLSLTIEADGRAAIFELDRVREAAEGASTDAARAYRDAGQDMADAFEPVKEAAEEAGEAGEAAAKKVGDAAESAGKRTEDANKRATKSIKDYADSMNRIGTNMTAAITAPLTALYGVAVNGASDLQETVSKTEVVFGDFSGRLMTWSETAIEKMGLAQGSALDMASRFGDMATGMGLAESAAASMSMDLTQLTADLASFKNVGTDQVAQALTGIFTGETESLKSLGVVMTQANLQAYALSQGITKQVSAMTQAEQVQLRYNYVMAQTVKAQGDFARTGNSFANQSRKLTQTLKEAGEGFGELLLPLVTDVIAKIQEGLEWITQLDDSTKTIILSTGMVVAAVGPLLIVGSKVLSLVAALKTALAALSLNPVLLGIAGVAAAGAAIAGIAGKINDASREIDRTSDKYAHLKEVATGVKAEADFGMTAGSQTEMETFEDLLAKLPKDETFEAEGKFIISGASEEVINAYAEALVQAAGATSGYADAVDKLNQVVDSAATEQIDRVTADTADEQERLAIAVNEGLISEEEYASAIEDSITEYKEKTKAIQEAAEAQKEYNKQLADGSLKNDAPVAAEINRQLYQGRDFTEGHYTESLTKLANLKQSGGDMKEGAVEGSIVNTYLLDEAAKKYESLAQAVQNYQDKLSRSDAQQAEAQDVAERAQVAAEAAQIYAAYVELGALGTAAFDQAIADMGGQVEQYAGLKEELASVLQPTDEQFVGVDAAQETAAMLADISTEATATAEQIAQTAQSARETAASELQATAASLAEGTSSAQLEGILQLTESAGAAISEADQQAILGAQQIVENLASTLAGGSGSVDAALQTALSGLESVTGSAQQDGAAAGESFISGATGSISSGADNVQHAAEQAMDGLSSAGSGAYSDGKSIGSNLMQGVKAGIQSAASSAANEAAAAVRNAINAAKAEADIHSPSRVMEREVGAMLTRGVGVGVQKETPEVVKIMRESTQNIISGGTQVVDRSGYTVPAMQSAGASGIDYELMGEKMTDAVSALSMVFRVGDTDLSKATRESTARQQAMRAHEINMGRGRVE